MAPVHTPIWLVLAVSCKHIFQIFQKCPNVDQSTGEDVRKITRQNVIHHSTPLKIKGNKNGRKTCDNKFYKNKSERSENVVQKLQFSFNKKWNGQVVMLVSKHQTYTPFPNGVIFCCFDPVYQRSRFLPTFFFGAHSACKHVS